MYFAIITLLTSLALATVAGWFSIIGIMAILAGAPLHALVAGIIIEIAKLVTTSWIYRNWNFATIKLKILLMFFTALIMLVTSMGVFGFLSKAHLEQGSSVIDNTPKVERLDQQIAREKVTIESAEKTLEQLNATLDSYLGKDRADRSVVIRKRQEPQRKQLKEEIDAANRRIDSFGDEKFKLQSEIRKFQLEVGPIRYIAELIYGAENNSDKNIERAVRVFILLLVLTLDPLAVTLLVAANNSLLRYQNEKKKKNIPPTGPGSDTAQQPSPLSGDERINNVSNRSIFHQTNTVDGQILEETPLPEEVSTKSVEFLNEEKKIDESPSSAIIESNIIQQNDLPSEDPLDIIREISQEESTHATPAGKGNSTTTLQTISLIDEKEDIIFQEPLSEINGLGDNETQTRIIQSLVENEVNRVEIEEKTTKTSILPPQTSEGKIIFNKIPVQTIIPVIKSPKPSRVGQSKIPWMHQSHILNEIIGNGPHFIPQKLNEEGQKIKEKDFITDNIKDKNIEPRSFPRILSWLKEFRRI